jgi:hypothetical protein
MQDGETGKVQAFMLVYGQRQEKRKREGKVSFVDKTRITHTKITECAGYMHIAAQYFICVLRGLGLFLFGCFSHLSLHIPIPPH